MGIHRLSVITARQRRLLQALSGATTRRTAGSSAFPHCSHSQYTTSQSQMVIYPQLIIGCVHTRRHLMGAIAYCCGATGAATSTQGLFCLPLSRSILNSIYLFPPPPIDKPAAIYWNHNWVCDCARGVCFFFWSKHISRESAAIPYYG